MRTRRRFVIHWLFCLLLAHTLVFVCPEGFAQTNNLFGNALPIHKAAASGNLGALVALVEATNTLEARDGNGLTPLQLAVEQGHLAAAALLLDSGADINARDPAGNTLLHRFMLSGIVRDVSEAPPAGWLARMSQDPRKKEYLRYFTEEPPPFAENLRMLGFILACGGDVKATNHAGKTAMQSGLDEETRLGPTRDLVLKMLVSADPDAGKGLKDQPAVSVRIPPELTIRTNTETGLMMFRDHWGEADVRLLGTNRAFTCLGTTFALDSTGTNFKTSLLIAIIAQGTNDFPSGYPFFNFGVQVRTATNDLDWSSIIGQKEYDVMFDPSVPPLPLLTVTQEGREKIDEGHTLFLYEWAARTPLREKPGTNRTFINLSYSAGNEIGFYKFIFQAVPGQAPLVACEPPARPGHPLQFAPIPWATDAISADLRHPVGLTVQRRSDWFIISCAPAGGSEPADRTASGAFISGDNNVRVFLIKSGQRGDK